jgi:ubiquinone/menaquinone biosynthesis C-methylase UbiE
MDIAMQDLIDVLRAIAEPTRLRILALCRTGELSVNEICQILGQSQPRVSRHLKLMVDAGVLDRIPEGNIVFHRLSNSDRGSAAAHQIAALIPEYDLTLDKDTSRLARIKHERTEKARAYFNKNAEQWDRLRRLHIDEADVERAITDILSKKSLGELLDIGTGTGRMLEILGPMAVRSEGIDLSRAMLSIARANIDNADIPNCTVRQGEMHQLPYAQCSFDTVVIHQVLHFIDEPGYAIEQAANVLHPGGRLLIVDFAPHGVEDLRSSHAHRRLGFPDNEVTSWFASVGLSLKSTKHLAGNPLTVSLWLAEKSATRDLRPSSTAITNTSI